jgi:hypothetical protein
MNTLHIGVLPGWERLQSRYLITRNETPQMVEVKQMSDAELLLKAEEYRKMGEECFAHADDIYRYRTTLKKERSCGR